jgi:hypothetical protein
MIAEFRNGMNGILPLRKGKTIKGKKTEIRIQKVEFSIFF